MDDDEFKFACVVFIVVFICCGIWEFGKNKTQTRDVVFVAETNKIELYEKDTRYYLVEYEGKQYYGEIGKWFVESDSRKISPVFSYNLHKNLDAIVRNAIKNGEIKKIGLFQKTFKK